MTNAKQIIQALGASEIAAALGVVNSAVRNAAKRGKFPPAWYPVITQMGEMKGVVIPNSAFGWKLPAKAKGRAHEDHHS